MASPAELVQTVSRVTGVALPTLVDIDRKLVKGQLRTKTGRGFSVAQMTPLDAARLLTALLASPQANAAVEAVERYAQTQVDPKRSHDKLFAATGLADLAALPAQHSFVEGLTALIASAATGALAKLIAESKGGWVPAIEIFAFTRATRGRIRLAGLPHGLTASLEYMPAPLRAKTGRVPKARHNHGASAEECGGDLEQSRRITGRTLLMVADLLAEEGGHD
jgi:hypothetical protein